MSNEEIVGAHMLIITIAAVGLIAMRIIRVVKQMQKRG